MASLYDTKDTADSLAVNVENAVKSYFDGLNGAEPVGGLYQFVLEEIEMPLLESVMMHCKYNQCKAAEILGLSRGTLRTKLRHYFDDKYVGFRDEE